MTLLPRITRPSSITAIKGQFPITLLVLQLLLRNKTKTDFPFLFLPQIPLKNSQRERERNHHEHDALRGGEHQQQQARGGRHRVRRALVPGPKQRREPAPMGFHSQGLRHLIGSASLDHHDLLRHRPLHSGQRSPQGQPRPSSVLRHPSSCVYVPAKP